MSWKPEAPEPIAVVTLEGLTRIGENAIAAANQSPHLQLIDAFLEMKNCEWCGRRMGKNLLDRGVCGLCRDSIRGASAIARHLERRQHGRNPGSGSETTARAENARPS